MAAQDMYTHWKDRLLQGMKARGGNTPPKSNIVLPPHVGIPSLGAFLQTRHDWERSHRDLYNIAAHRAMELDQHVGRPVALTKEMEKDHDARRKKDDLPVQANILAQVNWKGRDYQ